MDVTQFELRAAVAVEAERDGRVAVSQARFDMDGSLIHVAAAQLRSQQVARLRAKEGQRGAARTERNGVAIQFQQHAA